MSQRQHGGNESINFQAAESINITVGISATEARQIAVDVLQANLIELKGTAHRIFDDRLNHFVDYFLAQLQKRTRDDFRALADPDVQYSIFVAGRDYARSGDENICHILIDLLVERCRAPKSSLIAVVVNEAIATTGRLTINHVATLVIHWALVRVESGEIKTVSDLGAWLKRYIMPFVQDACWHVADYEYLAYTGTASIEIADDALGDVLRRNYPGLFPQGISPGMITPALEENRDYFFSEHPENPGHLQVDAIRTADAHILALSVEKPHLGDALQDLMRQTAASKYTVQQAIRDLDPEFGGLLDLWSETHLGNLRLTSVGVAIAHAYWAHITDSEAPLSIWIPDYDVPSKKVRK